MQRQIPDPGFADDDGSAAPDVAAALTAYGLKPAELYGRTLAILSSSRVITAVVAVLGEVDYDEHGRPHEKTADMASVMLTGRDGRLALLAFSSLGYLNAWNPQARPVPVSLRSAAAAALSQNAAAIVLDVAGPVRFVIEAAELKSLSEGYTLAHVGESLAWVKA